MKNLMTLCFLLLAFTFVSAQKDDREKAKQTILKTMKGQEYYYPVVGEMGYQKIASAEIDKTNLFVFKNKDQKELFWFRVEDSTAKYDDGVLIIWHGFHRHKLEMSKGKAEKIIDAFYVLNGN